MSYRSFSSISRSTELGLQLRIAAERGKAREVKRLLTAGATLTRDSVREYVTSDSVGLDATLYTCY